LVRNQGSGLANFAKKPRNAHQQGCLGEESKLVGHNHPGGEQHTQEADSLTY
jgi:hypothetical protein